MNDLAARSLRRLSRRRRLVLGRGSSALESWLSPVRRSPVRYTLHAVALAVGVGAMLWVPGNLARSKSSQSVAARALPIAEMAAPQNAAPITTPLVEPSPTKQRQVPKPFKYTVQPGDTLRGIAEQFGISLETLVWNNEIENPDLLRPEQELLILPTSGVLHRVQAGETLRQVAERYGVSLGELLNYNPISDPDQLPQGVELVVPGGRPLPAQVAQAPSASEQGTGSEVAALAELSPLPPSAGSDAPAFAQTTAPKPKPGTIIYEVQPGDSINLLTQMFGVDAQTILNSNDIENADMIVVGTKLRILPVSGLEHEVQEGETLADIAARYQVDLGPILDFNDLPDPDLLRLGMTLVVPGAKKPRPAPPPPPAPAVAAAPVAPAGRVAVPAAPAPQPAPPPASTGADAGIVKNALAFQGHPYVWGGTSPGGFDCSGFVYYVYKISGNPIPRGMWGQLNAGPRISRANLSPGDIVFFANTYMPGLSHNGIYIGGGRFIHASDPSTGVVISSMSSPYWASRYVGATRP